MPTLPTALLSNDDGIDSLFLPETVRALQENFEVIVAAPRFEQSWVGRGISRHRSVKVEEIKNLNCQAWVIDGTPSDCVNIALSQLLPRPPDVVVSGINIGYNITLPLIYSSGTIAAALEGAQWELPSIAASLYIPSGKWDHISNHRGAGDSATKASLETSARHLSHFALQQVGCVNSSLKVHNLNYPEHTTPQTEMIGTVPGRQKLEGLFEESTPGVFDFRFATGTIVPSDHRTDREVLFSGQISWSELNFSTLG